MGRNVISVIDRIPDKTGFGIDNTVVLFAILLAYIQCGEVMFGTARFAYAP